MKRASPLIVCQCGRTFSSYAAERAHSDNFPRFCLPGNRHVEPPKRPLSQNEEFLLAAANELGVRISFADLEARVEGRV